ncbi:MAG: hypothetical protein V7K53_09050 [Nostoc sp.]|uniref:hypothetical protein n=1 Tax=Nostoc sp. TaxID=1180 RepID=UPI002FF5C79D
MVSLLGLPKKLCGVKGKGERGKVLNPLPFPLSPAFTSAFLGWQTTCTDNFAMRSLPPIAPIP